MQYSLYVYKQEIMRVLLRYVVNLKYKQIYIIEGLKYGYVFINKLKLKLRYM